MKVAIHGKIFPEDTLPVIEYTLHLLRKKGYKIHASSVFFEQAKAKGIDLHNIEIYKPGIPFDKFDLALSIGGDGTLLETVTHVRQYETPILGVNTGRLGFLATTNKDLVSEALMYIEQNNFKINSRTLLKVEGDSEIFDDLNFGLNEVTVLKQDTSSMITVHTSIDGSFLNSYWADGLIIATPTGSTGYSLSCGGPVVMPHSNNMILTPVSPHNLNVRPLVVSDNSVISLEVESRSNYFMVSVDSRSVIVKTGLKMQVRKEKFCAKLISFDSYSFVNTLRKKLNWGLDARN